MIPKKMQIVVTAGPTREAIDPVRFITNHSTGTMGYAITEEAIERGHRVVLISGPTDLARPKGATVVPVVSALEMQSAVRKHVRKADCIIMAAAVSDFRPQAHMKKKLKRKVAMQSIKICKNPDILKELGQNKGGRFVVGFCMETEQLLENAKAKMKEKRADILVANKISKEASPFGAGKTEVILLQKGVKSLVVKNAKKPKIARILLEKIEQMWYNKTLVKL